MIVFRAIGIGLGRRPASAWLCMWSSAAVSNGNWFEREWKDSRMSELFDMNWWSRETILVLNSTRETIEATSPKTATALAMFTILTFNQDNLTRVTA